MDERPTHLDLFSGIGGFALAAQWAGFRTIGFCEIDKYCRKVLAKNFGAIPDPERDGQHGAEKRRGTYWRDANRRLPQLEGLCGTPPFIFENIFKLKGRQFAGVDLITGGFPCQPFSVAGKRRGAADDRALWPEMFRVINEARPAWVLGENVPGIIPMELDNVLSDLEGIGYATRAFVIPACAVDARHRRDRLWIVANANGKGSQGRNGQELRECADERVARESNPSMADNGIAVERRRAWTWRREWEHDEVARDGWRGGRQANGEWLPQSRLGGMADGVCKWMDEPNIPRVRSRIPDRVNRLKGLGNAIVPQVAFQILSAIMSEIEKDRLSKVQR